MRTLKPALLLGIALIATPVQAREISCNSTCKSSEEAFTGIDWITSSDGSTRQVVRCFCAPIEEDEKPKKKKKKK